MLNCDRPQTPRSVFRSSSSATYQESCALMSLTSVYYWLEHLRCFSFTSITITALRILMHEISVPIFIT